MRKRLFNICFLIGALVTILIIVVIYGYKIKTDELKEKKNEEYLEESKETEINKVESGTETQLIEPDGKMYIKSIQNLDSDNCITYDKGFYYFRSQKDYSLCKMDENGGEVQKLTDEIPGSIYVKKDTIYFINLTDNHTLYTIQTDGTNLTKVADISMWNMIVVNDKIYFLSLYDKNYDISSPISNEDFANDSYLYCMNMDGTQIVMLLKESIERLTSNGERLLYVKETDERKVIGIHNCIVYELCSSALDGKDEKVIMKTTDLSQIIPYQGYLYYTRDYCLFRTDEEGANEEYLLGNVYEFTISESMLYTYDSDDLCVLNLQTDELKTICDNKDLKDENYSGDYNRGLFVVNGQILLKYWESEDRGVVWHKVDKQSGTYQTFEQTGIFKKEDYVTWTNMEDDTEATFEELIDEDESEYLANALVYKDYYRETEESGEYIICLPQFNSTIKGYKQINRVLKDIYNIMLEDKEETYEEYKQYEEETEEACPSTNYTLIDYGRIYVSGKYVIIDRYKKGYSEEMGPYNERVPLIFDKNSGAYLEIDDIFMVDSSVYKERIARILYKYLELRRWDDGLFDGFNTMPLLKSMDDAHFFFIKTGIVIGYDKYSIYPGACGSPEFEIPYNSLTDVIDFQ